MSDSAQGMAASGMAVKEAMRPRSRNERGTIAALILCSMTGGLAVAAPGAAAPGAATDATYANRCDTLGTALQGHWPDPTTRLISSRWNPAGPYTPPAMPGAPPPSPLTLPDHCEVLGILHERVGVAGQHYAIRFHLRLPASWNGRFFFQGGGGSDGVVGEAVGPTSAITPPALVQGFAVVSQDSGHDNATNSDPARGGAVAFGFDPRARADYGHASLKVVADAAKAAVEAYYGKSPMYSYFVGCSKGGQEGMVFAQRYPTEFNGIIAAAPGFALPRAAVAEAWDLQSLAAVGAAATDTAVMAPASTAGVAAASDAVLARPSEPSDAPPKPPAALLRVADAFSESDLNLVRDAILSACDADDGVNDGMVSQFKSCTDARPRPALAALRCAAGKTATCLTQDQLAALQRMHGGPRDSRGRALYRAWQWDAGIVGAGWRLWKMGSSDHKIPALNVALGGSSLAAVFTTPPTAVNVDVRR